MRSANIVKKLEKEGYKIYYKKWGYWDGVPHVQLEGFDFTIAEHVYLKNGWMGCNVNFIYNHVLEALDLAKNNNPITVKKMNNGYWDYSIYLIDSMEDYYMYKKNKYPFDDDYSKILERLKNEK